MKTTIVKGSNSKHKVFVYALSTCGWCKKTKELLKENSVQFEYLDVDSCSKEDQTAAVEHLKTLNIPVAFPVVIIDETKVVQGFKKDKIIEELGL